MERGDYCSCEDLYFSNGKYEGQPGLYRLTHIGNRHSQDLYFDYAQQLWLKGDWYGLRFLSMHDQEIKLKAHYNQKQSFVVINKNHNWPMIYEKALVLASGLLPETIKQKNLMLYRKVSEDVLKMLAKKLNVSLEVAENA